MKGYTRFISIPSQLESLQGLFQEEDVKEEEDFSAERDFTPALSCLFPYKQVYVNLVVYMIKMKTFSTNIHRCETKKYISL